jgi:hypothetical protein
MKIILSITILICLTGCNRVSTSDSHNTFDIDIKDYGIVFPVDSICNKDSKYTGYVYMLDASCSICISTFFNFVSSIVDENKDTYPISIIVDEGYLPIVEYYTSMLKTDSKITFSIYENISGKFLKESLTSYNDIVLFYEDNIMKHSFIFLKD